MSKTNDLVSFLRCYGPIPTSENMYDELIQEQVKRYKVEPVDIPPARLKELIENFSQLEPKNTSYLREPLGTGKRTTADEYGNIWTAIRTHGFAVTK